MVYGRRARSTNDNTMTREHNPYLQFTREQWATLRDSVPLTLTEQDLQTLRGINERVSLSEVEAIYLPLSRLINLYVRAKQRRSRVLEQFLGQARSNTPYIISIAGSVAGGKSTTARILQALLERWADHPKVELITTDGFLYPNDELEKRGLMRRKGFPESYDIRHLVEFVANVRAGHEQVEAPVYSHLVYDIIPDEKKVVEQPDILILEGLNVLQSGMDYPEQPHRVFVSDFVDFSIYVDADDDLLRSWYIDRFLKFRSGAFSDPNSYFHHYAQLSEAEATGIANNIWEEINYRNLVENILPTRERANLILTKGPQHAVEQVKLRK
ncbi:pantothenate kinase [Aeromonas sp. RU39B]|jgi:type I pantothenate kinase|nr:pantothenate kinase [Aeromonas sp. RU39B]